LQEYTFVGPLKNFIAEFCILRNLTFDLISSSNQGGVFMPTPLKVGGHKAFAFSGIQDFCSTYISLLVYNYQVN
jgi:hypothetical protein